MWEKVAEKSESHWLQLREPCPEPGKDYTWHEAIVKWDGCVHFHQAGNIPFDEHYGRSDKERPHPAVDDYIHICDVDDMIARLQALKAAALEHFGPDWPH